MRVATALEGLEGIASIADDVLIYGEGETDEEADVSHDILLVQLMERCKERSLKLNPKKFKFKLPQLKFMGHWMTKEEWQSIVSEQRLYRAYRNRKTGEQFSVFWAQ